jgi:hypothetical protein
MNKPKTPVKVKSKLISAMRKIWMYSEMRKKVLDRTKFKKPVGQFANGKAKTLLHWHCEICSCETREPQVDHIEPAVPLTGWDSWDGYIARMFTEDEWKLRVLCDACHSKITNDQRIDRIKNRA